MKTLHRHWKWLVVAGITVVVEVYLLLHIETILYAGLFLAGRSDCSFGNTVAVADWTNRAMASLHNAENNSRVLREEGGRQLWTTPLGEFWIPGTNARIGGKSFAELEMGIYGSESFGIRPGDIVIDCGASIGEFTRLALNRGAAQVVAVEPAAELVACLERTFRGEISERKVVVYPKGVWNQEKTLALHGKGGVATVVGHPGQTNEMIRVTTIDKLATELGLNRIDFIKMDIEGAEKEALEGARRILLDFKPRMAVATEHSVNQAKEITDIVHTLNSNYSIQCGPCSNLFGRVIPYVVYFR